MLQSLQIALKNFEHGFRFRSYNNGTIEYSPPHCWGLHSATVQSPIPERKIRKLANQRLLQNV